MEKNQRERETRGHSIRYLSPLSFPSLFLLLLSLLVSSRERVTFVLSKESREQMAFKCALIRPLSLYLSFSLSFSLSVASLPVGMYTQSSVFLKSSI